MQVYEIRLKVYLLKDISLLRMQEKCTAIIDKALFKNETMKVFHEEKKYKNYCVSGLYPIESDKVYKEGKIYSLLIRTVDQNLKNYLMSVLEDIKTDEMKGLTVAEFRIKKYPIKEVFTVTPAIIKNEYGYWKGMMSLEDYERRLFENLCKKYKNFSGEEVNEDFDLYTNLQFKNSGPIVCQYKNIKLLGDKLILEPDMNEMAQELIYMALGTGLAEINARGYGFLAYTYL